LYHFRFCSKDDPTVTASLYIDNLAGETKVEIVTQKSINKKSLTLAVIERILENKEAKQQMIILFKKKQDDFDKEGIKQFLNKVTSLLNPSINSEPIASPEQSINKKEEIIPGFPVPTYVIATTCIWR
jgi:hypothetical protein